MESPAERDLIARMTRQEPEALRELDHAGEAFIAGQLERSFRTLDYYKSLLI